MALVEDSRPMDLSWARPEPLLMESVPRASILFSPPNGSRRQLLLSPHLTDKETEAQRV